MSLKDGPRGAFDWNYGGGLHPTSTSPTPFSGITGTGPSTFTQPTPFSQAGTTSAASLGSAPANEATLRQWLTSQGITGAGQDYWISAINSKPDGLQSGNAQYWMDRIRSGQAENAGGGPMSGAFTAPFNGQFSAPTGTDDPGFQFAVEEGQKAMERSAAAKGNLLTGGFMKDLAKYTTGAALQNYQGAYDRALNTFDTNYGIFRNNQQDPFSRLLAASNLGYNAANSQANALSSLGTNQANLSTGMGNINAGATATTGQNLSSAFGNFINSPTVQGWFRRTPPSGVTGQ